MDAPLIDELVRLLRTPAARRDRGRIAEELPRMAELARVVSPLVRSEVTQVERLLNAGVARSEPRHLRRAILAYWGLPPFAAVDSAKGRQAAAASAWAEDFAALERTDKVTAARRPTAGNTLRSQSYKQYFAEVLAGGVTTVVREAGSNRRAPYASAADVQPYRPKLPVAVTLEDRAWVWLDDEGRKYRARYEHRDLAMAKTNGVRRFLINDGYAGYRQTVKNCSGCELIGEEQLNNDMRRVILQLPPQDPGHEWSHSFELHTEFDDAAPAPEAGVLFTDEISDDFEAHLVVYFGKRLPAIAWYFDDLPRPLVPGEPHGDSIMGLDTQGRLAWNFFPPTNARKCYGLAWRFEDESR